MDTALTPRLAHEVGERIKVAREVKGLSIRELADAMGCSDRSVQGWEAGNVTPGGVQLRALALALGTRTDYLLGLEAAR